MRCLFALVLTLSSLVAQVPLKITDQATARQAELLLQSSPGNSNLAGLLLDYYLYRWTDPKLHDARIHLILWMINNRPDIDLANAVHDARGLNVDPDDKEAYAQTRAAWLMQAARQPGNARLLANAAMVLRLTDRQQAVAWLKNATTMDTENIDYERSLATVYADALTGIAAMDPQETPTRLDPDETKSLFARQIREEIDQDSILSARTGWAIHMIAMSLRAFSLTNTDYDTVAEELLINAANLDYPKPTKLAFLAQFYRDQALKVNHKIRPKFAEVEVQSKDAVKTLVDYPKRLEFEDLTAPVKISLNVTVGIDGHIWSAESATGDRDPHTTYAAASLMESFTFQPVRLSGEPIVVTTSVDVTLEPPVKPGKP
jgi:hypothetical protein